MKNDSEDFGRRFPEGVINLEEHRLLISHTTVELLEQLLAEAKKGEINGVALVTLRNGGRYDLLLRGTALESANQLSVVGMLAARQKTVLELHG
jgi:hypothetical protein